MSDAFSVSGAGTDLPSTLRANVKSILLAAGTLAGNQVETSRDEPTTGDDPCTIAIYTPQMDMDFLGNADPQFKHIVHVFIVGRVAKPAPLKEAETLIDKLRVQIWNAVFCSTLFWQPLEQVSAIKTTLSFPGTGDTHEGILEISMQCQATETFVVKAGVLFTSFDLTVPGPAPQQTLIGATVDLPQGA